MPLGYNLRMKKLIKKKIMRKINLTPARWEALEAIAQEVEATAERGTAAGMPSIPALLRLIADGRLVVKRRYKKKLPE